MNSKIIKVETNSTKLSELCKALRVRKHKQLEQLQSAQKCTFQIKL